MTEAVLAAAAAGAAAAAAEAGEEAAGPEAEDSEGELRGRGSVEEAWVRAGRAGVAAATGLAANQRLEAARLQRWRPRPSEELRA